MDGWISIQEKVYRKAFVEKKAFLFIYFLSCLISMCNVNHKSIVPFKCFCTKTASKINLFRVATAWQGLSISRHRFQLLLEDLQRIPSHLQEIISFSRPGYTQESVSCGISIYHKLIRGASCWVPLDCRAPDPVREIKPSSPAKEPHFHLLYLLFYALPLFHDHSWESSCIHGSH